MCRYKMGLLPILVLFCISAIGQTNPKNVLDSFSEKFITSIRQHEKQQALLVTDKSIFKAGETIWLKAFLLNALSERTYTKSKFLLVDIVNEKDSAINTIILDAANKQLNSKITLPPYTPAGYYWLRAYTRQMVDDGGDGIAVQPIYILNGNNAPRMKRRTEAGDSIPVINFYPEGNSIITGVNSTVAVQVNNKIGEPLDMEVNVKDNRDSMISRFKTNSNGLGKFVFEPSGYRKYRATINWHGQELSYPLPSFNFFAGQLSVVRQQQSFKLRVLLGDSIYTKEALTYIIGLSKDSLVYGSIGKGQYEVDVPEQTLPAGITTFYLFDKNMKFLSERSVYRHDDNLIVKITTDKELYSPREKVSLNISVTDAQKHPVQSLITVSAIDTVLVVPDMQNNPVTTCSQKNIDNILLARYGNLSDENADLMMLIKSNTYGTIDGMTTGVDTDSLLFIKGKVLDEKKNPAGNKIVSLVSKTKNLLFYADTTDVNGRFRFPIDAYEDSTEFILEVRNPDGKSFNGFIVHDTVIYPKLKMPVCLKQYLPIQTLQVRKYFRSYPDEVIADADGKSLQPVTVTSITKNANYNVSKRLSGSSVIIGPDKINVRNPVSSTVLLVGGMQVLNGVLVMLGPSELINSIGPQSEPILIVDGVQTNTGGSILKYLDGMNPREIEFIEVLKGPEAALFGVQGGNGVISVNTRSQMDANQGVSNIKTFFAKGVSTPALFPNMAYDKKSKKATATVADNRSTLFWSGNYLTDEAHNPTLNFYTNDIVSTYIITVTGITIHGDVIYKTLTFQNK